MPIIVYDIDGMAHVGLLHHMNELAGFDGLTSRHFADGHWWVAQDTESFEAVGFSCITETESRIYILPRCGGQGIERRFNALWEERMRALGF